MGRHSMLCLAALLAGCDESSTGPPEPLPAVSVVIVTSSCQGLDLCGQCPIETLILDKNSNRFHGFRRGSVVVRAEVVENGVFDQERFEVPDCSLGL